jgi:exosortase
MTDKASFDETRIRTVVLVGGQDFGRCLLASRLPLALWPVGGKPMLERLLRHLAGEGIRSVALCCGENVSSLVGAVRTDGWLAVRQVVEELSSGTAGCLRDAVAADPGDLILVLSGSMVCPPSIRDLVDAHAGNQADLTVVFNPDPSGESSHGASAEIYLCRPDVLKHVPAGGYCDIKEGLIPAILRAGGTINPVVLPHDVGNFHDQAGYLDAISLYLEGEAVASDGYALCERSSQRVTTAAAGAGVDPEARIYGPVAVAEGTRLAKGAVVVGPAVLDRGAQIGKNSIVVESVLWDGCKVGDGCEVRGAVVERGAVIPDGSIVAEETIPAGKRSLVRRPAMGKVAGVTSGANDAGAAAGQPSCGVPRSWLDRAPLPRRQLACVVGGAAILAAFLWSYAAILEELWKIWQMSKEESAGLLVPFLAAYILWSRRRDVASVPVRPALFWGTAVLVLAQAVRIAGLWLMFGFAERLSIVLSVVAIVIIVFGWAVLRKVATIMLFLCLMLPWPHRVQAQVSLPLQSWATGSAVFCLELIGYEVVQDGNLITIGDTHVDVDVPCNGLRMVTAFLVISGLVVLLVRHTLWEKLIVLASSLPVALLCNTVRLTLTAMFFTVVENESIRKGFHDSAGYAMMPLALALVVGEFWLLGRLVTPHAEIKPAVIARRRPQQAVDS